MIEKKAIHGRRRVENEGVVNPWEARIQSGRARRSS
jgi:hypothetical protein